MRRLVGTVLVLALLAVGAVVADVVARRAAEQRVATAVAQAVTVSGSPQVRIQESTPFLLQLVRGTVDSLDVTLSAAQLQGLTATDVHVTATEVAVAAPHRAGHVAADGVLPTATVQQVLKQRTGLDATLRVDGGAMKATGTLLGLELAVTLTPRVDAGRLLVDVSGLTLAGRAIQLSTLPTSMRQALTGLEVPVDGLPQGLVLTGAQVVPAGVHVTLAGDGIVASSPSATPTP